MMLSRIQKAKHEMPKFDQEKIQQNQNMSTKEAYELI